MRSRAGGVPVWVRVCQCWFEHLRLARHEGRVAREAGRGCARGGCGLRFADDCSSNAPYSTVVGLHMLIAGGPSGPALHVRQGPVAGGDGGGQSRVARRTLFGVV